MEKSHTSADLNRFLNEKYLSLGHAMSTTCNHIVRGREREIYQAPGMYIQSVAPLDLTSLAVVIFKDRFREDVDNSEAEFLSAGDWAVALDIWIGFIIFNTKVIIFNTQLIIFHTKFIIFNTNRYHHDDILGLAIVNQLLLLKPENFDFSIENSIEKLTISIEISRVPAVHLDLVHLKCGTKATF